MGLTIPEGVALYGVRQIDIVACGCTSRGQAIEACKDSARGFEDARAAGELALRQPAHALHHLAQHDQRRWRDHEPNSDMIGS